MDDRLMLQRQSLFISAGHSSTDPGAVANGHTEAEIVTEFRNLLDDALHERGLSYSQDGQGAQNMPLKEAMKLASAHDVSIEIHCNAATPAASGVETLSHPEDYALGRALCGAVSDVLGIPNRGAKPENSGQHSRLAFVSYGGGIILELFFITNREDLASYFDHKHDLADAIADVLMGYVCPDSYGKEVI